LKYPVFVYGTLLDPAIQREVIGRQHPGIPAILRDYQRYRLRNYSFPGLVAEAGAEVGGIVLKVNPAELKALDEYEDPFYERRLLTVEAGGEPLHAYVYVIPESRRHLVEPVVWDLDYWRRNRRRR